MLLSLSATNRVLLRVDQKPLSVLDLCPMSIRVAIHLMTLFFATLMAYPNYKRAECTATNKVAQFYAHMERIGKKACEKYLGKVTKTKIITKAPTETSLRTVFETHVQDKPVTVTKVNTIIETSTSTISAQEPCHLAPLPSTATITIFTPATTYMPGASTQRPTRSKSAMNADCLSTTETLLTTVLVGYTSTSTTTITSIVPVGCMVSQNIQGSSDSRAAMTVQSVLGTSILPVRNSTPPYVMGTPSWLSSSPSAQNSVGLYSISWSPKTFNTSYLPMWQNQTFGSLSTPRVFPNPSGILPRKRTMLDKGNETYFEELLAIPMLFARDKDWVEEAINACHCLGWPSETKTSMVYTTVKEAPKTVSDNFNCPLSLTRLWANEFCDFQVIKTIVHTKTETHPKTETERHTTIKKVTKYKTVSGSTSTAAKSVNLITVTVFEPASTLIFFPAPTKDQSQALMNASSREVITSTEISTVTVTSTVTRVSSIVVVESVVDIVVVPGPCTETTQSQIPPNVKIGRISTAWYR